MTGDVFRVEGDILHVGARQYHASVVESVDTPLGELVPWRLRRVRVMLESGWQVSIIYGDGTHSSNYFARWPESTPFTETPADVEVGVFNATSDELLAIDDDEEFADTVQGHRDVSWVNALITVLSKLPTRADPTTIGTLVRRELAGVSNS